MDKENIECHKEFDKWARLNGLDVKLPDNQYSFEAYRNPETLSIYRGWKAGWEARKLTNNRNGGAVNTTLVCACDASYQTTQQR